MAEHEIKLVASLDTSNINTNAGTTGATTNRTTSSGGSASNVVGTAIVGSQLGIVGSAIGIELTKTIKLLIKSLSDGIYLINFHLHNILNPLKEITREFSIVNRGVDGISKSFEEYEKKMKLFDFGAKNSTRNFVQSLNELKDATREASKSIKNSANKESSLSGGSLLGMKFGNGGGFGEMFGRIAGAGAIMSAYSGTRQIFDITDP